MSQDQFHPNGSETEGSAEFLDYYELMQISPNAEHETILRVYKMLAARYHPDNAETGDMNVFMLLNQAKEVLSNPELRAQYDAMLKRHLHEPLQIFSLKEFAKGIDGEENRRMGVLCLLYNRRRTQLEEPGLSVLELENLMACPREHLMFALWYLKEKNYVRQDDRSNFVVTGDGVDFVEEHLPKNKVMYKLLKAAESGNPRTAGPKEWTFETLGRP